jgi:hypothetical protein
VPCPHFSTTSAGVGFVGLVAMICASLFDFTPFEGERVETNLNDVDSSKKTLMDQE